MLLTWNIFNKINSTPAAWCHRHMGDFKCLLWRLIVHLSKGAVDPSLWCHGKRHRENDCVFAWSAGWLAAAILTQRSAEINGTEERRSGEKVWFHMQVAVKDVYPKRPVSLLSPKLEMNKSLVQFTPTDGLISSGGPVYPNRLCVIMSTSVFIWDFTLAFIGAEGSALQVKHGWSSFKSGTSRVSTWV